MIIESNKLKKYIIINFRMKNQNKYQEFVDEQSYSTGIPIGQPLQYQQGSRGHVQAPYFQQELTNPYQNMGQPPNMNQVPLNMNQNPVNYNQMPNPMQGPMIIQPHSSKVYNSSINVRCQCCKQNVQTIVNNQSGNISYIWAAAICCFVGQCCCLPFMFDDCLDKVHYCPNCGQSIIRKHAKCFDIIN